jgi:alkaline phosphatase D
VPDPLSRRNFLGVAAVSAASFVLDQGRARPGDRPAPARTGDAAFPDGVIAGDPQPDGAVIWTRFAGPASGPVEVVWEVAEDAAFDTVAKRGVAYTRPSGDHTVAGPVFCFYPAPRFPKRTTPDPSATPDRLRFAFASCQQRNDSFYVAHRAIVAEGVDFLVHLGDYIYVDDVGDVSLADYHARWRTFRSNPLLQDCHAAVPLVAMWDDGEFYNGVDRLGDPTRLGNAKAAFFDFMPVLRQPDAPSEDPYRLYRSFSWGDLADLFVLDVRQYRDPAIDDINSLSPRGRRMFDPDRTTLGAEQKRWLKDGLAASTAAWRILGSPYDMMALRLIDLDEPWLRRLNKNLPRNAGVYAPNEAWDDYQAERRELLEFLRSENVGDVVVCSGHTHVFMAGKLAPDIDDPASPTTAVEFVTGSLTADPDPRTLLEPLTRSAAEQLIRAAERYLLAVNPHYRYINLLDQGYAVVDVTPEHTVVEFRVIDTFDPEATPTTAARFLVVRGVQGLTRTA